MPNNYITNTGSSDNDPFWNLVSLYIKGNGVDQSPTIVDEKGHTITKNGVITLSSAASVYPGGTAIQFNGAQRLFATPTASEFAMGTGDFTYEAWVLQTNRPALANWMSLDAGGDAGIILQISAAGNLSASGAANGITFAPAPGSPSVAVPFGAWDHIALCRSGNTLRYFLNGVFVLQVVNYTGNLTENAFYLGAYNSGSGPFTGYMNDIRITKAARYTASFTPGYGYPTHL